MTCESVSGLAKLPRLLPHLCIAFSAKMLHFTMRCCQCSVVQQHGVQLVTDAVSYELLKGATVDYTTDLIRASFEVRNLGLGMASNGLTSILTVLHKMFVLSHLHLA